MRGKRRKEENETLGFTGKMRKKMKDEIKSKSKIKFKINLRIFMQIWNLTEVIK